MGVGRYALQIALREAKHVYATHVGRVRRRGGALMMNTSLTYDDLAEAAALMADRLLAAQNENCASMHPAVEIVDTRFSAFGSGAADDQWDSAVRRDRGEFSRRSRAAPGVDGQPRNPYPR